MDIKSMEELEKLSELKSKGVVTEAEFQERKDILLGNKKTNTEASFEHSKDDTPAYIPPTSILPPFFSLLLGFMSFSVSLDITVFDKDIWTGFIVIVLAPMILGWNSQGSPGKRSVMAILGMTFSIAASLSLLAQYNGAV